MSSGACRFCGKTFKKGGIARHIASCTARGDHGKGESTLEAFHRLVVTDEEEPDYWLHLLAVPEATLGDLDRTLRGIWLECCGHQSMFHVAREPFFSQSEGHFDTRMDRFPREAVIRYLYDFAFSTKLSIRRLEPVRHARTGEPIILAARNDPPLIECGCGAPEATLFSRSLLYESFDEAFLCPRCLPEFEGDPATLAPLTNSPRMGVRQYHRSELDREGDYPGFDETESMIRAFYLQSDTARVRSGDPAEREEIVQREMRVLGSVPVGADHFRTARFISSSLYVFAPLLRQLLLDTVDRWERTRQTPRDYAHVFALLLLAPVPDGELFVKLVPLFSRFEVIRAVWGDALQEPRVREPLWASLCLESPELLQEFVLQESTAAYLRYGAVNSLVTLYLEGHLERESLVPFLEELAARAVAKKNADLAGMVAAVGCTIYPEDLIRPIQRMHRAGLLDASGIDYLDNVRELLRRRTREEHLAETRSIGFFTLLRNAPAVLEEILSDPAMPAVRAPAADGQVAGAPVTDAPAVSPPTQTIVRDTPKVGRNAPCPCGSGRKYKHCCGKV
ncbi:MAG: DUF1186 domain-containing protein [Spirochaetaceae bacterium]|nr:MAG: DUF1186 domain-containing protein [Spirochaetaceae bacterium]